LRRAVHKAIDKVDLTQTSAIMLEGLTRDNRHQKLLDSLINQLIALLQRDSSRAFIARGIVHWLETEHPLKAKLLPTEWLSEQAIASALAEHKRVFIDVTADWCVTCKANKYNVLLRDDVQQALLAPDVVALRGDWSRPSADISQFLTARGSAAVPFNQIYGPELPQGQILPALLDREHLLATLSAAKGK
ncbi:thioredoxin family protein, partial [Klebsiella pneumoniae]